MNYKKNAIIEFYNEMILLIQLIPSWIIYFGVPTPVNVYTK